MKIKITSKLISDTILLILLSGLIVFNSIIIYGVKMGIGQLQIVLNSRPVEQCMNDGHFPDSLKKQLLLIQEIRKFAQDSLDLKNSPNYTSVYDQHNKPAIWVLTACEPFNLKIKTWWFPLIGKVPYKGFFSKEEAESEQKKLMFDGYDTKLGSTNGWSTLGWFKDPILSNMLLQNEGNLAELIFHELTHSTIFIRDDIQFNENLANFIGEVGAKKFLQFRYGIHSKEILQYLDQQEDELTYNRYMLQSLKKLDSLYKSFSNIQSKADKKTKKEQLILEIVLGELNLNLKDKIRFIKMSKRAITGKNAFFMEFIRYDSRHDYFYTELLKDGGNLRNFIDQQKRENNQ